MFIECSDCHFKYLVNSADLKPNGRTVECANCRNQWFQEPVIDDKISLSLKQAPSEIKESRRKDSLENVKNLPSTFVRKKQTSLTNTFLVLLLIFVLFFGYWILKNNGLNFIVLLNYYIEEFFFNIKLIISDIAKIIYNILN